MHAPLSFRARHREEVRFEALFEHGFFYKVEIKIVMVNKIMTLQQQTTEFLVRQLLDSIGGRIVSPGEPLSILDSHYLGTLRQLLLVVYPDTPEALFHLTDEHAIVLKVGREHALLVRCSLQALGAYHGASRHVEPRRDRENSSVSGTSPAPLHSCGMARHAPEALRFGD